MSEAQPEYLTVAQAAARLGVSERAVQKRCATGKLAARRSGSQWEVLASDLTRTSEPQNEPVREPNEPKFANRTEGERTDSRSKRTEVREPANQTNEPVRERTNRNEPRNEPAIMELLAQSREEILFLRSLIEQRDRDAAELRAALRKALEVMPKALPDGNGEKASPYNAPQATIGDGDDQRDVAKKQTATRTRKVAKPANWQRIAARVLGIR